MKRMILSDESLNSYGFWVKTEGISLERFLKNPIMLYNHHRTGCGKTDEILPIGRWENLEINNGVLTGVPVFDENDEFAMKIKSKVENGFLTGCSIGITITSWSENKEDLKQGQIYPTAMTCELMEVSIVDIPANPNSAGGVILFDNEKNVITLANGVLPEGIINKLKTNKMSKEIALKLGLAETASPEECTNAIEALKADKTRLEKENADLKKEKVDALKAESEKLINEAIKTGRIDAKAKEQFEKLFSTDFDNAKSILEAIPQRVSLNQRITEQTDNGFEKMSWDELDRKELLAELKAKDPALYERKYNEKFKKD